MSDIVKHKKKLKESRKEATPALKACYEKDTFLFTVAFIFLLLAMGCCFWGILTITK